MDSLILPASRTRASRLESDSQLPNCVNQSGMSTVIAEQRAQPMDMHIHRTGIGGRDLRGFMAPDVHEQVASRQHHATMTHQIDEQIKEQSTSQFNRLLPQEHLAPPDIDGEI